MARQGIGTGSSPNDGSGDNLRVGAAKVNDNFSEIYTYFGDGTNLNFNGGVWDTVSAGINTISSVGIGTTNPRFTLEVGAVGASGTSLYVNGDARVTGILTVGSSSITLNGSTNEITVGTGITISGNAGIISATKVTIGGETLTGAGVTSLVAGSNITLSGSTGRVTINASGGGGSGITTENIDADTLIVSGVSTLGITSVTGHTLHTKQLNVSGVSTFNNPVDINGTFDFGSTGTFNGNVDIKANVEFDGSAGNSQLFMYDDNAIYLGSHNDGVIVYNNATDRVKFARAGSAGEIEIDAAPVTLKHSNSAKLTTTGTGVSITGNVSLSATPVISRDNKTWMEVYSNQNVIYSGEAGSTGGDTIFKSYLHSTSGNAEIFRIGYGNGGNGALSTPNGTLSVGGISTFSSDVTIVGNVTVGAGTSTNGIDSPTLTLSHNNPTVVGTSGTTGEIKQIGGAPFFYDGAVWREFVLATGTPVTRREDSDWDNVMLRLDFEDSTTNIADIENKKVLATGQDQKPDNVQATYCDLTGSPVKYGSQALRFTGGGTMPFAWINRINGTNDKLFDFEGAWTIEMWIYVTESPGSNLFPIVSASAINTSPTDDWSLLMEKASNNNNIEFKWYNLRNGDSPTDSTPGTEIAEYDRDSIVNQWNHIALVRDGSDSSMHFYLNGVESNQTNGTISTLIDTNVQWGGTTEYLSFGYHYRLANSNEHHAKMVIDDVRISKSVRYTSNFTAPSAALPIAGTASTVYTPPGSKQGEIALGNSPTWTGMSGVTASRIGSGHYRATFSSAFSNASDYVITTSMNDHIPSTTAVGIGVTRYTGYADFIVSRVSDSVGIDSGSLAINLIKK